MRISKASEQNMYFELMQCWICAKVLLYLFLLFPHGSLFTESFFQVDFLFCFSLRLDLVTSIAHQDLLRKGCLMAY